METIEGTLKLVGNATTHGTSYTYSVIEIGDRVLNKMVSTESLDNFLRRALNMEGTTILYVVEKRIIGVGLPDGKIYCYGGKRGIAIFLVILGFPMILFFGLGFIFIRQGIAELHNVNAASSLRARGAITL